MKNFIVLTNRILNTKYIQDILIEKNKYIITLASNQILSGCVLFGSGYISNDSMNTICIERNEKYEYMNVDYNRITKYIEHISHGNTT